MQRPAQSKALKQVFAPGGSFVPLGSSYKRYRKKLEISFPGQGPRRFSVCELYTARCMLIITGMQVLSKIMTPPPSKVVNEDLILTENEEVSKSSTAITQVKIAIKQPSYILILVRDKLK